MLTRFHREWLVLANTAGQSESALIHRGVAGIEKLLCTVLEPPDDISEESVDLPPGTTSGKLLGVENRAAKQQCRSCHQTIDPIGLAFESFDAVGGVRSAYPDGVDIDTAGQLPADVVPEVINYTNAAELMTEVAATDAVGNCYARKWLEWSTGQPPTPAHRFEVARSAQSTTSIRELLLEVATSPLMLTREES